MSYAERDPPNGDRGIDEADRCYRLSIPFKLIMKFDWPFGPAGTIQPGRRHRRRRHMSHGGRHEAPCTGQTAIHAASDARPEEEDRGIWAQVEPETNQTYGAQMA